MLPALLLATSLAGTSAVAETVTYTGTGTFVATRTVLPLANGGADGRPCAMSPHWQA